MGGACTIDGVGSFVVLSHKSVYHCTSKAGTAIEGMADQATFEGAKSESAVENPLEETDEGSSRKKLKEDSLRVPRNSYLIECVVENLQGGLKVLYIQNRTRKVAEDQKTEIFEPFMPSFRSVFMDNVQDEILIHDMGARCAGSGSGRRRRGLQAGFEERRVGA